MPLSMVGRYPKSDLVFRGYPGKWSRISWRINELTLELVFRGQEGKWSRIPCIINYLSL
jgi:hypothetical protein